MPSTSTVVLGSRFNGPPGSANGGYACGMAAGALTDGPAEVVLRRPPPLDVPLEVVETLDGVELRHDGHTIAAARHWSGAIEVPPVPEPAELEEAVTGFDLDGYAREHPFDRCFTCGPAREDGDGLRIFPGPIAGTGMVAWPWRPAPSMADDDGLVSPPVLWAALDCPSGLTWMNAPGGEGYGTAVLARMAATIDRRPEVGEALLVAGWQVAAEGRKLHSGGAVWGSTGEVLASSSTTWVVLDEEQLKAFGATS